MKKTFKLEELDCANCAAKMERAINDLEDVMAATVNFMAQKLVVEIPDEKFEATMKLVQKAVAKVDPDCEIIM
ncbi:MAG: cation transporter [Lachnospiraceae bacterium]|nr:cation transporter [Lachnospiraceae bacterium]